MLKTFLLGALLGLIAAAAALNAVPAVDQARVDSITSVAPNGGNVETFRINIPTDRVLTGVTGQSDTLPPDLKWPEHELLAQSRTEIFKIRNARDTVVGVAVRNVADEAEETTIDWVLHLPARGSLFINMDTAPTDTGNRLGEIRAGSREFAPLSGFLTERWVEDESDEQGVPRGHMELVATYVGQFEYDEPVQEAE